jgi:hypothetical protein
MLTENDILWNLNNPLSKAHMNDYDDDTGEPKTKKIPPYILNSKKNVKAGDTVCILNDGTEPVITEKITGTTIKDILKALERGYNKVIKVSMDNNKIVYNYVSKWLRSTDRIRLIQKYESNELVPIDLIGDKYLYCGNLKKIGKIWLYCRE